jgi:hypothetical protein
MSFGSLRKLGNASYDETSCRRKTFLRDQVDAETFQWTQLRTPYAYQLRRVRERGEEWTQETVDNHVE